MDNGSLLIEAIKQGDAAKVSMLLERELALADARTANDLSVLLLAVYYGKPEIARMLAEHRSSLDIFEASVLGDLARVRALLDEQPGLANAFAPDGFQPLGLACFFGQVDIAVYLLSMGAEVNSASQNSMRVMPLHSSVARKDMNITRILLSHGADVNAVQTDEFTPLHEAAQNGQLEMVKLLIQFGADPDMITSDGKSALDLAIEYKNSEVASFLSE